LAQKADGKVIISTELDNSRIPKGVKEISGSLSGLKGVVRSLGAAIGAAFSVMTIVNFAKESVSAANALSDALTGLKSILDGQGRSFSDAEKFLQEYTADGLVPMTNAITAYKNLASRGYDDSQIRSVMQALKDASAFGRAASYSMGEAVQSATEGLKNENSVLVDNAGVTKNVAKMWEEYAASIGTTANNLTQQQKIQAEVNGILEESKYQAGDAAKVAGTLSGQLSQLSVNFNNLKVAVGNAIKPIVQSFLPVVNTAVAALTRFANAVAQVVGALFGNFGTAVQEVADGYSDAASGAEDLADATEKAGKAVKKYLAGFDEITRIGDGASGSDAPAPDTGGSATVPVTADGVIQDNLSPQLQALVDKILALLEPLKQIDLGPLAGAFDRLKLAVEPLTQGLFAGLEWAWYNILVPLAAWTIEDLLPAFLDLVSAALGVLNEVIIVFQPLATWLWENFLAPVAEWTGGMIVELLGWITDGLTAISDWIGENQALVEGFITVVASFAAAWGLVNGALAIWNGVVAIWNNLGAIASGVTSAFGAAVGFLTSPIGLTVLAIGALIAIIALLVQNWDTVSQVAADVWDGIVSVWEDVSGWFDENVLSPLAQGFRDTFNGIIGFINGLISGAQSGINSIIRGINRISFTVPDWVPGIGGMTMGFNLSQVSFPQIPYLAQGAVLPANKPFLAMVGDQKHGTNVEAPLATIQEAVALVMDEYAASNLAGQEAILEVLREILEAVLGIEIGDDVLGQAVARYNRKMAVVRGGT
jgi:hypothetical protein